MAGLNKFIALIRLFDERRPSLTVQEMAEAVGMPASTVYRLVRELVSHRLLEPATEAHYRLGAAFIEFDRMVRRTDPLLRAGVPLLPDLVAHTGVPCVAVLARLYGDRVICAADQRLDGTDLKTSYERGRPMPLTRGATSRAILAQLPARKLRKLLQSEGGMAGQSDETFRLELANTRKHGYCVSRGEVDEGLVGIAVPVSDPDLALSASLSLIVRAADIDDNVERKLVLLAVASANMLTESLAKIR